MTPEKVYNEAVNFMQQIGTVLKEPFAIPATQHTEDIEQMKKNIRNEYFFFTVNLTKASIENANGVFQWLGYPENSFTFKKYMYAIHPSQHMTHAKIANNILQTLFRSDYEIKYLTDRFISNTAIRHADGTYLLFKRISSPWQWDANHKLSEYLNEFYLLGKFDGESFNPRSANISNTIDIQSAIERQVRDVIRNKSEEFLPFTTQQYRILRLLAYNPDWTEEEVGAQLSISVNTVHTHSKKLLPIARDYFSRPFLSTKEVAIFLRKEGIL
jgi:hypothetical protein